MNYLLDTNICIYFLKNKFNLRQKFQKIGFENMAISEITLAEMIYGAKYSQNIKNNLILIERFTSKLNILQISKSINIYAEEKANLRKSGNLISDFDLLIGSTAIYYNMIMVTRNIKEFKRISAIKIENWIEGSNS